MNNKKESFWNYLVILFGSAMKTVESLTTPEIGSNLAGVLKKLSQDFKEICLSYIQAQKENRTQKIKNEDSKPIYPPPIPYRDECRQKPNKNNIKRKRRKNHYKKRR